MLSRVAERMYWLGRYVERAENTARLLAVNANLILDMPSEVGMLWKSLVEILSVAQEFTDQHGEATERNVMKFLVASEKNAGSLVSSLRFARENARTVREIVPSEAWEVINDLYWSAKERQGEALTRKARLQYLDMIVMQCHQLAGIIANTMSHREPHHFVRSGCLLERADMTSRILDVGCTYVLRAGETLAAYENILWTNVLLSLSAYQMYRQSVRERINPRDVVAFLLQDTAFPHAIAYCLEEYGDCMRRLPRHETPLAEVQRVQKHIAAADPDRLIAAGLHEYIDALQTSLARCDTAMRATWFGTNGEWAAAPNVQTRAAQSMSGSA